ncbi:hypothetical protein ACODT5_41250 [Streptomyces sp. 5.8]|uniref:hypothetical protein n=1 Tax=Streptomyces sp. 5.8 TaxID=3406571 RepID=UPI003BB58444
MDVIDVSGGYYGLSIGTRGLVGDAFSVVCQKSNMAVWRGWHVRADRIADAVMDAAERARAEQARAERR